MRRAAAPAFEADLLAAPKAVPLLRHAVREHLGRDCPDVQLAVSELLSNVVRHVGEGSPVTLRVSCAGHGVTRVEVTDSAPDAEPAPAYAECDAEGGRGLTLLDAVACRWGVVRNALTKTVWCELPEDSAGT
ncbi:ATP-binding protein [Streptomyces sp. NPDC096176]|uniref:ATP-binding protein n=1 Tax=Streptomyces sp. NPDC096176 TaxID=3366079 RepID=UPI0038178255